MPKKILFESAVHQFVWAGTRLRTELGQSAPDKAERLAAWLRELQIENPASGTMRLSWRHPAHGEHQLEFKRARFYLRGDTAVHAEQQRATGLAHTEDRVMAANMAFFDAAIRRVVEAARLFDDGAAPAGAGLAQTAAPLNRLEAVTPLQTPDAGQRPALPGSDDQRRKAAEEAFHDAWASGEDVASIDVRRRNEACTAPEMRHIRAALGDLRGKSLLDLGCGLGEASVYFALLGARVTATDVSAGMCTATRTLAAANGVELETHVSAAEDLRLGDRQFDVIYTGNTLHHVDIAQTMDRLLPHLRADGVFVSWDPVAYNPLINVYRRIAMKVRTPDEHPLRRGDIRAITGRFAQADVQWFWFSTLLVFLWMVFVRRMNPNRVRLWKRVIDDADSLAWLYRPLERLDRVLLEWLPFLRPLCWNVVIVGRHPNRAPLPLHA
ncbi:MAG: class I SAM-dependent methyltransferase [Opitutaceae bacterium]|nr:class I SAM-dependent methyltransferase [Opitutaceae bacterium]